MTPKHAKPEPPEEPGTEATSGPESPIEPQHSGPQHGAPKDNEPDSEPDNEPPREGPPEPAPDDHARDAPTDSSAPTPATAATDEEPAEVSLAKPTTPAKDPTTPAKEPVTEPSRSTNAAAPRSRRRRGRRVIQSRWMWIPLGVLGVVLVAWMLVAGGLPEPQPPMPPTVAPTQTAEQRTLLLQVRNDSELGAINVIAATGGSLPGAQLLVPSRLIVDVPGAGQQSLGQSARLLDRSASQDALSDLLALRIDGTLSLARLALAGMVDFVGGITIDVDQPILAEDEETGEEVVAVRAGTQSLDGTQAATYALAWLPDEPEAARMARASQVLTATIAELPDDVLRIQEMLTSLGGSARTTTSTSAVAEFLQQMGASIRAGGQQVRGLPTSDLEAGALAVVRADLVASDAVLSSLMPQAMLADAESSPRVLVQNGVGTPGLGAVARDRLVGAEMVYINGGNAERFGAQETSVIVADETADSIALGDEVADALEVPDTAVQIAEDGQNVADVVVVLGADFEP